MPLVAYLVNQDVAKINLFNDILSDKLKELDAPEFYEEAAKGYAGSADTFLYARCAVVANGRDFYRTVIEDSNQFPENVDFEILLGVARRAYQEKTGEVYARLPRSVYETMWNRETWGERAVDITSL